jgi:DNA-binding CsgD family transcriptional regulator
MIGGSSAWLSQLNMIDGAGDGVIARIDPVMPGIYQSYYALRNPLSNVANPREYLRNWVPKILTDEDWMPKEDLLRSEYYNDFLVPQDVHATAMVRLATDGFDVSAISVNRSRKMGQFGARELEIARALHPHLIRAYGLTRKVSAIRQLNGDMAATLDASAHGIILLAADGRIRHVNRAAEAFLAQEGGLCVSSARLSATAPDAARRLGGLIASAAASDRSGGRGGSMALSLPSRRLPLSVTVAPVRAERASVFDAAPSVLVCITDLEAGVSLPEQTLRDLFGLTPAETRVTLALFEGFSPQEAAETLGISANTVRVHLGRIFEKTGAHRQAELVQLMMRAVGMVYS